MLSALAVSGLFTLAACDEDESTPVACAEGNNPCTGTDAPYCYANAEGKPACVTWACDNGYDINGKCKDSAIGGEGAECKDSNECADGLSCYQGHCSSAAQAEDYKFVQILDLTPLCTKDCTKEDPGADIDAIVLKKGGSDTALKYASRVSGYHRGDNQPTAKADNTMAADPDKVLGAPDSFVHYPTADQCNYYNAATPGDDKANRQYTFVSLGGVDAAGVPGYLEVEMEESIEAGDTLDILELGECALYNTEKNPMASKGTANAEKIRVQISIKGEHSGDWRLLGEAQADKNNRGIISFNIQ